MIRGTIELLITLALSQRTKPIKVTSRRIIQTEGVVPRIDNGNGTSETLEPETT